MLKKHERTFSFLQKVIDALAISFCWLLAYWIRFDLLPGGQVGLEKTFLTILPGLILVSLYFYHQNGLYRSMRFSSRYIELLSVMKSNTQATFALVVGIYFLAPERLSRIAIFNYFFISQLVMCIVRIVVRNYLRYIRKKGKNLRHIVLAGDSPQILDYLHTVRKFKDAGIKVIGWIDSDGEAAKQDIEPIESSVIDAANKFSPDTIVFGYSHDKIEKQKSELMPFSNDIYDIQILPDISYTMIGSDIENFQGIPVVHVNRPNFSNFDFYLKRAFDFLSCTVGVLLISPLLLFIAFMVKASSPGPIFFGQRRIGLDGKEFTMWKFRSMKIATSNEDDTEWSNKENPRKTKFGDFIRKTSLDELPQLFNVILGQMSLVGPRPERPFFVDKFRTEIPNYMLRHKLPPGITGWAQINGWRGDTSIAKRIDCDIYYIKNWSFWLDIKIVFLTFLKGFVNKNAY
jgi:Undecaprenyl-phosphate glucose phosphotransferase